MSHACSFLLHHWASLHSNRKLTSSCLYFWPCLLSGRAYVSHGIHIRTIQNGLLQEEMHMRRYTFFASLNAWNFSKTASAFWSFISSRPLDRRHTILHFHFAVISSSRPLNHSYRRSGTVNIENKINLTSDSCWVIVTNAGCQFKSILFSLTWFHDSCWNVLTGTNQYIIFPIARHLEYLAAVLSGSSPPFWLLLCALYLELKSIPPLFLIIKFFDFFSLRRYSQFKYVFYLANNSECVSVQL